jgi:HK97 family phage prohead protease
MTTTTTSGITKQLGITGSKLKGNEFTAMISTDTVDRDGEVLVPDGCYSKNYDVNPVLLWMHDPDKPVGTGAPGSTVRRKANGLSMKYVIPERPEGYEGEWFPSYAAGLVAAGVLRTVSVRFRPLDGGTRMPTQADLKQYGPGVGRIFSKWELLEVSLVSIPANADAMIEAVTKHHVSAAAAKAFGFLTDDFDVSRQEKRRIVVTVPAFGSDDYEKAARRAALKAAGKLYGPA